VRRAAALLAAGAALAAAPASAQSGDYSFDPAELEVRPWQLGGFAEARAEHLRLRPGAALFPLSFPGTPPRQTLDRGTLALEAAGTWRRGMATAYARAAGEAAHDAAASGSDATLLEGGLRLSPREGLSFDLGKQVQRWGKGYAWNPVGFFERPKDPDDPTASREGFVMASADWVASRSGTLAAVGLTPVLLPVSPGLNQDYGAASNLNPGARLYLLVADTDVDLLWAARGTRPARWGLDFSRNLGPQWEVHGEWARTGAASRPQLLADGSVAVRQDAQQSWLAGVRFVSEREVTWLAELYRNGAGHDAGDLAAFYRLLDAAFGPGGTPAQRSQATALAQAGHGRPNPGRRYAYLRVSAKDPFGWLYVTPAVTLMANLDDGSRQLAPELLYAGWQDMELRVRALLLQGGPHDEFGAKAVARRLELLLRLYY
jgi:hypothetical protein